jgi:hypothetical protein
MRAFVQRLLYHPVIVSSTIYLAEVMYRSDWSIGSSLVGIAGGLLVQFYRVLGKNEGRRCCPMDVGSR